jgi:sugar phosphate isomerase/epimerase
MKSASTCLFVLAALLAGLPLSGHAAPTDDPWARENIQAWCIVPYDAKKRSAGERAQMLKDFGIHAFAYDFRPIHIPKFDEEVQVMKTNGIEISAWWFPMELNDTARTILSTIERHGIKPELWVMRAGGSAATPLEQQARVQQETDALRPIVLEARRLGLKVGLYNHGGWFGDPENQLLVLQRLRSEGFDNVGIVYNFHHAHDHIRHFDKIWPRISPYVIAVNLNGMMPDGDRKKQKIMFLGDGTEELAMMRVIRNSGWRGRVGVVSHVVEEDAAVTLGRNLAGYDRLIAALRAEPAARPKAARQ